MIAPYYENDHVTLYLGDSLEILPLLGKHADAVVTDPPYVIPSVIASGKGIFRNIGDLSVMEAGFKLHMQMWKDMLGDTGRLMMFCSCTSFTIVYRAAYEHFHLSLLIWDKCRLGLGHEFRRQHELIMYGWGDKTLKNESRGAGDVIRIPPVPTSLREHPAEKPIGLVKELLKVCGDTIVDPFMGSGAIGIAARLMGKRFIGIDIEERYCEVAARRFDTCQK